MKIKDVMEKIRNIDAIIIIDGPGMKSLPASELEDDDGDLEIEHFEVTHFCGEACIEFTV